MSQSFIITLTGLMVFLVSATSLGMVQRFRIARDKRLDAQQRKFVSGDSMAVAVTALFSCSGNFLGSWSRNSLKPSMSLTPTGLSFRVLWTQHWPFAEIEQVDLRKQWSGARLVFVRHGGQIVAADVADLTTAKAVLAALPRTLPMTASAAILRDGTDAAATPGLRRYRGPTR